MIWAIKNDKRIKAKPKLKAVCPLCKKKVISKCGEIKIWHWAHKSRNECDSFCEPESEWHLNWKKNFPKKQQEVIIKKEDKYHIADIKTKTGLVIELQHSIISQKQIRKREEFYKDMIWLLDGNTFGKNMILKKKCFQWKWAHSILWISNKPLFIDFGIYIFKIKDFWKFRNRTYFSFIKYSKKDFLHLYGDLVK